MPLNERRAETRWHCGTLARIAIHKDVGKRPSSYRFIGAQIAHAEPNHDA
jgi:hypothetical protein